MSTHASYKQCSFCLQCYIFLYIVYQYIAILGPYIYCNILKHFPYGNVLFNIQYIFHVFLFRKYSASARTVQGLSVKYSQVFVEMGGGGMSMCRLKIKCLISLTARGNFAMADKGVNIHKQRCSLPSFCITQCRGRKAGTLDLFFIAAFSLLLATVPLF